MTDEEALDLLEHLLDWDYLNQTQAAIFRQVWTGKSYRAIAASTGYEYSYVKDEGAKLWRRISDVLGRKVTKRNIRTVLRKTSEQKTCAPSSVDSSHRENRKQSWDEVIDASNFYGRTEEKAVLTRWISQENCRLIALLGIGGIGKTALSIQLLRELQGSFDYTIWKTLRNAVPLSELLPELVLFLSEQKDISLSNDIHHQIDQLLKYLHQHRCLLVLDNLESILLGAKRSGCFQAEYEDYQHLLERIADESHQSCLLLTSREKPSGISQREGDRLPVRTFLLSGLSHSDGRKIIQKKGLFPSDGEYDQLTERYCGNPLAINIAVATVINVFGGDLAEFLDYGTFVFGNLWTVLQQQFERLSALEKTVMYWLAISRDSVKPAELEEDIFPTISRRTLLEAIASLKARSLIETSKLGVTQQPVVMEFMTERLIASLYTEINQQRHDFLSRYALIKSQAKDFIRESQVRLIVKPLLKKLLGESNRLDCVEQQLQSILSLLKEARTADVGYAGGNLINLMCQLDLDLAGQDFSNLPIWQAYLAGRELQHANFAYSDLSKSVFNEAFGGLRSVAFSPNGKTLAASDSNGEIHLWQVANAKRVRFWQANKGWTWFVGFSPDGKKLVSGSDEHPIKIWEVATGKLLNILRGHKQRVWGQIAWCSKGKRLASGCEDYTIRIWDVETGQCISIIKDIENQENRIRSVIFLSDETGRETRLISGSTSKNIVQIWDLESGQCLKTMAGHQASILSLALSADRKTLFTSSADRTLKAWDVKTGRCIKTCQGHTSMIWSVALSNDRKSLFSASEDKTVRMWDVKTGECLRVLQGFSGRVLSVACSPDSRVLASGSDDQMLRLWDVESGRCFKTLKGYSQGNWAVAFNPDGTRLASGGTESVVRIWEPRTGNLLNTLKEPTYDVHSIRYHPRLPILAASALDKIYFWNLKSNQLIRVIEAHQQEIWEISFSPDGSYLASASFDRTAKLWDWQRGLCLHTLGEHHFFVCASRFSPDGRYLATGSLDMTVKLWDYETGKCMRTLSMDDGEIYQLAFSPNSRRIICGDTGGRIRLWDIQTYECLRIIQGHQQSILTVAYSPDGTCFASGSHDQTVKIWDVATLDCRVVLRGHQNIVFLVTFSPDGKTLATASHDGTVRVWEVTSGDCLQVLRSPRPYEAMNIQGATGLTHTQKSTLQALGAIQSSVV